MKHRGWIVYNQEDYERNRAFAHWILQEANHFPMELQVVLKEQLQFGIKDNKWSLHLDGMIRKPDFVIMRNMDPLFSKQLEALGIRVFNRAEIAEMCNHKGRTHQALASLHIPMLDTLFVKVSEFRKEQIPFSYPIVVKEVEGRGGKQVYLVDNKEQIDETLRYVHSDQIIIQPLAQNYGKDIRVYIIGKEIIAAVKREAKDSFKSNYSLGGHASIYRLSLEEKKLVQKIVDSFPFDYVGMDFLLDTNNHLLFNEIEDVVGSRMLSHYSNINIVHLFLKHIISEL